MTQSDSDILDQVYSAASQAEIEKAYDAWTRAVVPVFRPSRW